MLRELAEILAFEHRLARCSATHTVELPWGVALRNERYPMSFEHNRVLVREVVAAATVHEFAEGFLADRSKLVVTWDANGGSDVADFFESNGYDVSRDLVMIWETTELVAPRVVVERLGSGGTDEFVTGAWERAGVRADIAPKLTQRRVLKEAAVDVEYFAVRMNGAVVAQCELYREGAIAQVDAVLTHPDWQRQGFATGVVTTALQTAMTSGSKLVFLRTSADDWPQGLYRGLGFRDVATLWSFDRSQP